MLMQWGILEIIYLGIGKVHLQVESRRQFVYRRPGAAFALS